MSILNTFIERPFFLNLNEKWQKVFLSDQKAKYSLGSRILYGNFGSGKTHEAILELKQYCLLAYPDGFQINKWKLQPDYLNFKDLQAILEANFDFDGEVRFNAKSKLQDCIQTEFLILDDLDTIVSTDFRKQNLSNYIYDLLDYRYNNNKTTVITTNATSKALLNFYGGAVIDRLFSLCESIKMIGESKRKNLTKLN